MRFEQGASRWVFLIGRWAFKVPRMITLETFLWGWLGNRQEKKFSAAGWPELCPVVASVLWGLCVVMPRVVLCSDADFPDPESYQRILHPEHGHYVVPAEWKPESFGYLHGRKVVIDYGSPNWQICLVSVKKTCEKL